MTGPTARTTDPDTSHAAAEAATPAKVSPQRARVLLALHDCSVRSDHQTATAAEAVMRMAYGNEPAPAIHVCSRRITDLCQLGYVEDSGQRRPGFGTATMIAWRLTADGLMAVARMSR